jgi:hypothetical protein
MRDRRRHPALSIATLLVAALVLGLSGPAGAAEPARNALPDSAEGRRVAAFFDAFGSGSEERLAEFFSGAAVRVAVPVRAGDVPEREGGQDGCCEDGPDRCFHGWAPV